MLRGLAFDGLDLFEADQTGRLVYIHSGLTTTIRRTFKSPAAFDTGFMWDEAGEGSIPPGLVVNIYDASGIAVHLAGKYGIVNSLITTVNGCIGLAFDGTNLITTNYVTDKVYIHSGMSSTIADSFAAPDTTTMDATYVRSVSYSSFSVSLSSSSSSSSLSSSSSSSG